MADNENTFLNANSIYEEVEGESGVKLTLEEDQQRNLIGIIKGRFAQAEDARQTDETRWLKAYENYRGLYAKGVKFRESEKSRVFVKVAKTLDGIRANRTGLESTVDLRQAWDKI